MKNQNYMKTILVNANAQDAYQALTSGHSMWWTPCDGAFKHIGDRIKFAFLPQASFWTFEAKDLIAGKVVTLTCVDAHHIIQDKPNASRTEWLGTTLRFTIDNDGEQTKIDLEHDGLVPSLECYDICEAGWDHFFLGSLKAYLDTGTGMPHKG